MGEIFQFRRVEQKGVMVSQFCVLENVIRLPNHVRNSQPDGSHDRADLDPLLAHFDALIARIDYILADRGAHDGM